MQLKSFGSIFYLRTFDPGYPLLVYQPTQIPFSSLHIYIHTQHYPMSFLLALQAVTACECPQFPEDSKNSPESTITQVLLGIFLVAVIGLFIVGSVLLGLCVHYMRKKQPLRSLTASPYFHESGSVKGDTLTRSISRSSYNSDTSSSSGRSSRSHNSERSGKSIHSR